MKLVEQLNNLLWESIDLEKAPLNEDIDIKLISEKEREEYIERFEVWKIKGDESDPDGTEMKSAYSKIDNSYIGTTKQTKKMIKDFGLSDIQKAEEGHSVSSIGYAKNKKQWLGWSHRSIHGFGIGDKLFDEKYKGGMTEKEIEKVPFKERGTITIKTMEQAKKAASNFARHVS